MRQILLSLLLITFVFPAGADPDVTGFFPFFLSNLKNYGALRKAINASGLDAEEKSSLIQPIAKVPASRRLPKLKYRDGVYTFSAKSSVTRVDPINAKQGLFKVNGQMVLVDKSNWQASQTAVEKSLKPNDPARAMVITMFASWYACEKDPCPKSWIGDLSSNLRAEYNQNQNARAERKPARQH